MLPLLILALTVAGAAGETDPATCGTDWVPCWDPEERSVPGSSRALRPPTTRNPVSSGGFRWSEHAATGPVTAPSGGAWIAHGPRRHRQVPGWAGAATYEVVLLAPASGDRLLAERALVQVPELEPGERASGLVLAFHDLGRTEREVFLETDLPRACAGRGWVLVAPYGLLDDHAGQPPAQRATAALLERLDDLAPHDPRRVYAVGKGMGGLTALAFAMRHQDPRGPRVAGVIAHSPVVDLAATHADGLERLRRTLEARLGGTPAEVPFAYRRTSPVTMLADGRADPRRAPVVGLAGARILLHANLAAPDARRVERELELARFLAARGRDVVQDLVFQPEVVGARGEPRWATLDVERALDRMAGAVVVDVPRRCEVFADRPGRYGAVEVRRLDEDVASSHGRLRVRLGEGEADLLASEGLARYALHLESAGLDPGRPLRLSWSAADGSEDTVLLTGHPRLPARVLFDGHLAPARRWWWDAERGEVGLRLAGGLVHRVDVLP